MPALLEHARGLWEAVVNCLPFLGQKTKVRGGVVKVSWTII